MSSNFPGAVDSFRAVQNRPSRPYNPDETTVLFAEDQNNHSDSIRATQQYIKDKEASWSGGGLSPIGTTTIHQENLIDDPTGISTKGINVAQVQNVEIYSRTDTPQGAITDDFTVNFENHNDLGVNVVSLMVTNFSPKPVNVTIAFQGISSYSSVITVLANHDAYYLVAVDTYQSAALKMFDEQVW